MIWLALLACKPAAEITSVACDYCDGDCTDDTQTATQFSHVAGDVTYDAPPPMSGDHSSCWTAWGVHDEDPGDEYWVHNLEHGGVVFLYQPADCATGDSAESCGDQVAALEAVLSPPTDARWIIAPYDALPSSWGAVSWEHRRLMGCFDLGAMVEFFNDHVAHGREDVSTDPPESCM